MTISQISLLLGFFQNATLEIIDSMRILCLLYVWWTHNGNSTARPWLDQTDASTCRPSTQTCFSCRRGLQKTLHRPTFPTRSRPSSNTRTQREEVGQHLPLRLPLARCSRINRAVRISLQPLNIKQSLLLFLFHLLLCVLQTLFFLSLIL